MGILLLVLAAGFITYLVLTATKRSSPATEDGPVGIGSDSTPLGDTAEHAGRQDGEGRTVGGQDADRSGGTGRPVGLEGPGAPAGAGEPAEGRRFQRDPIGGEAEARPYAEAREGAE